MTKDTKVLLAVFVVGMVALGVFNYVLNVRFLGVALQASAPKATPVVTEAPTAEPSPSEEANASPSARGRATATPRVSPSASAEPTEE